MFKGILRILISYTLILFSLLLMISLVKFSPYDLFFYTTAINTSYMNILGIFGVTIATPFVFFYGYFSWIWVLFSLSMGISILIGIEPRNLLIRFVIFHAFALLSSVLLSVYTANFSFLTGGIFGAIIGNMIVGTVPNFMIIAIIVSLLIILLIKMWPFPYEQFSKYLNFWYQLPQTIAVTTDNTEYQDNSAYSNEYIDELEAINNSIEIPSTQYNSIFDEEVHYGSIDTLIDDLEPSKFQYHSQLPSFLQEIGAEDLSEPVQSVFISKKPLIKEKEMLLRDVDVDLLSPYLRGSNSFYDKIEENTFMKSKSLEVLEKTSLIEDVQSITEGLDELDQSSQSMSPSSEWVRESGVSVSDFIRVQPKIKRLSFSDGIVSEIQEPITSDNTQETPHSIISDHTNSTEDTTNERLDKNIDSGTFNNNILSDETEVDIEIPIIPQHISNFPPVSTIVNDTPFILEELDEHGQVLENFSFEHFDAPTNDINNSALEITESERILINGIERTMNKQKESSQLLKEKLQKQQQKLADIYYNKTPVQVEQQKNFDEEPVKLASNFILQYFEQEILALQKESGILDTVSQVISDDNFLKIHQSSLESSTVFEPLVQDPLVVEESIDVAEMPDNTMVDSAQLIRELMIPNVDDIKDFEEIENIKDNSITAVVKTNPMEEINLENEEEYNTQEFASLIRMDLGEVELSDITELTQGVEPLSIDMGEIGLSDVMEVLQVAESFHPSLDDDLLLNNEEQDSEAEVLDRNKILEFKNIISQKDGLSNYVETSKKVIENTNNYEEKIVLLEEKIKIDQDFLVNIDDESTDITIPLIQNTPTELLEEYSSYTIEQKEEDLIKISEFIESPVQQNIIDAQILNREQDQEDIILHYEEENESINDDNDDISTIENNHADHDIVNLDTPESLLMPSIVTDSHLIPPAQYPIIEKAISPAFIFPKIEDLEPNTDNISKNDEDTEIENTMKMIEDTYESFNINMQVVDFHRGPTITRFELEPPSGLKLRTILNLQDDLALQAGTSNLRIISPVEGRSLIGIEVPNKVRRSFLLREQIDSTIFEASQTELPLILGIDVGGEEIVGDLTTTPHLLIAGTTGSGKSVYVNALIMGLLFKLSSEDLKFIMVDPKMVELELYSGIPHLLAPIITKPEEAMAALEWAVQEMDRRYKLFSELSVRNIKEYKNLAKNTPTGELGYEKLPYIVIVVDEFANLMLRSPKDTEKHISRLASMSRAVGIHLVLATQRPSVDVVTGVIKANFPSRIAFRVSSKIDSRTIIDRNGAETLLGKGDMLFMSPNYMDPIRIQSPYASSEDISKAVNTIKKNGPPEYAIDFSEVLARQEESNADSSRTDAVSDLLFEEVLRYAVDNGEISASGIQRRFRVGYNRASRLIESMKDMKIISPPPSAGKGWSINITRDEIQSYLD